MGPRQEFHSPESQVACRNIWHSAGTAIVGANLVRRVEFWESTADLPRNSSMLPTPSTNHFVHSLPKLGAGCLF